jgi:iron complex outermembrane receptor protein
VNTTHTRIAIRRALLGCTAMATVVGLASVAHAQAAPGESATLAEVVVTAQKREQSLQDVPIAITAVTQDVLQANRITNVGDLASVSPGLTARPSIGGAGIPAFSMRGVTSYGVVPGSDKSVSLYIDGVYIGSATGSLFDLPDVERIEVLRGPQGTLFGRNATAGAVSIITRNPTGQFGVRQELTYGNYNQFRSRTRIDFPQLGPISASINYLHDERDGDIKNTAAGTRWDRSTNAPDSREGIQVSPKRLGGKSVESWFAAVRFQPVDDFSMTYKFDHLVNHYVPDGTGLVATNTPALGPLLGGAILAPLYATQTPGIQLAPERPKSVANGFVTGAYLKVVGHNLTTQWRINDSFSVKNTLAFRKSFLYANSQLDGANLVVTQAAVPGLAILLAATGQVPAAFATAAAQGLVGQPYVVFGSMSQSAANQWSDEVQFNYESERLTLTTGALYFHITTQAGSPPGLANTPQFRPIPSGVLYRDSAIAFNYATSAAAYAQGEFHITPEFDLVAGYRLTQDKKNGVFYSFNPVTQGQVPSPFTYKKTKPAYLVSLNYKPNSDTLVYAKYSAAFVSGGSVGGIAFDPEDVESWEGGLKADLLDRRLRTNISIWKAKYHHIQAANSGTVVGRPELATIVLDNGPIKAHGFEAEVTALPFRGLTLNAGVGYEKLRLLDPNPVLKAQNQILPTLHPKWTTTLSAAYETEPLFGEARLALRTDANWRDKMRTDAHPAPVVPQYAITQFSPASWIINARASLHHIKLQSGELEVAVWGKNINDNKARTFLFGLGDILYTANYQPARTFGIDVIYDY